MVALTIAVICLAGLLIGDLLLTFGLIRRFRLWIERASGTTIGPSLEDLLPAAGTAVGAFSVRALDGSWFNERDLRDGTTGIAFLSTSCPPCAEIKRDLVAGTANGVGVAFVQGDEDDFATAAFARELATVIPKVVVFSAPQNDGNDSDAESPLAAFRVPAFPALLKVQDGVIEAAGLRLDALRAAKA